MYKVLIVDDEPEILEGLKRIIHWEEYGLEVAGAVRSSEEALSAIKSRKIHILVTDIRMHGMSGLELIKATQDMGYELKTIIISGYDDFPYMKEAIKLGIENYLLKPVNREEMISTLATTIDKLESDLYRQKHVREGTSILKNNILYRWVTNNISSSELLQRSSMLNIKLSCGSYLVSIIKFLEKKTGNFPKFKSDCSLLSFAILNICEEILGSDECGVAFHDLNGDIILLFSGMTVDRSYVEDKLRKCIENVNNYIDIDVFAAMGSIEKNYQSVHNSYINAKNLLEYFMIMPPNTVIGFDKMQQLVCERQNHLDINFEIFKNLVVTGKKEKTALFIKDIFYSLTKLPNLTPSYVKNTATEFLFVISNCIKSCKGDSSAFINKYQTVFANMFTNKTLSEIEECLISVSYQAIDFISNEDKGNILVKKMIKYIEENFAYGISLNELSYILNISSAYLGRQFKKETGDFFTDYVNRIRIKKAQELLLHTNLKTNEVAEKVGFADSSYFYRTFKRLVGVTPSEFRKTDTSDMQYIARLNANNSFFPCKNL